MTVPDIPDATPEGRMSYPKTPVQSFTGVPLPSEEVQAAFDQAIAEGGSGVLYPMSPRIAEAKALLESPQGFGAAGYDISSGAAGGWPTDVEPPEGYETPLRPGP
jgi:hypothetical protein